MLQITAAGRLGRDSELRAVGSDKVLGFSVAVDVGFGDKKKTEWIDCSLWGKRGETLAQYLTKGACVTVSGDAGLRSWESNGKSGTSITCRVNAITLQGGKRDSDAGSHGNETNHGGGAGNDWYPPEDLNDSIPFILRSDATDRFIGINHRIV